MSWVMVGIGGGALMNYMNNQAARKRDKANMQANAAQIEYSPWTHASVQMQGPTAGSNIGSLVSGGLAGGMQAANIMKAMSGDPTKKPEAPVPPSADQVYGPAPQPEQTVAAPPSMPGGSPGAAGGMAPPYLQNNSVYEQMLKQQKKPTMYDTNSMA